MIFSEALKLIDKNSNLIGSIYNCDKIEEFLIIPSNRESYNQYVMLLKESLNPQAAILPFIQEDVEVYVLTRKNLFTEHNLLCIIPISNVIPKKH